MTRIKNNTAQWLLVKKIKQCDGDTTLALNPYLANVGPSDP